MADKVKWPAYVYLILATLILVMGFIYVGR
jgi:hypothetical protein